MSLWYLNLMFQMLQWKANQSEVSGGLRSHNNGQESWKLKTKYKLPTKPIKLKKIFKNQTIFNCLMNQVWRMSGNHYSFQRISWNVLKILALMPFRWMLTRFINLAKKSHWEGNAYLLLSNKLFLLEIKKCKMGLIRSLY